MKPLSVARFGIVAGAVTASAALCAVPAFAAAQVQHFNGSVAGMPFDLGPSPAGLPSSCQFGNDDANFVFLSGNGVFHDTANSNGDWGGETMEGAAVFYESDGEADTPIAQGHLTIWEGGGNNAKGQTDGGLTLSFKGTGPDGTVEIHVSGHMTTDAQGQPTAEPTHVAVTCS